MVQLFDTAWVEWRVPWYTAISLVFLAILYLRGFARVHRQMPERFPRSRLAYYVAGIAALALALVSPLEALDDQLLLTHMLQHLLLLMVAPPLLLLGAPQIPLVRALPPRLAKRTIGVFARSRICRHVFAFITHPAAGLAAFSLVMLGWHLPGPFQAALRSDAWHIAEHGCMVTAGLMFWYAVVRPWPAAERWPVWALLPYLIIADAVNSLLGGFMVLSGRLLYPFYASMPRIGSITPINDQVLAGAIMWVPGSILFLIPTLIIMMIALRPRSLVQPRPDQAMRTRGSVAIIELQSCKLRLPH